MAYYYDDLTYGMGRMNLMSRKPKIVQATPVKKLKLNFIRKPRDCYLEKLDRDDEEYQTVKDEFNYRRIKKIVKVYNPLLEAAFEIKGTELKRKFGVLYKETYYHTTSVSNVDDICKYGFDYRLSGSAKGHKHGHGISFTPCPYFARLFGNPPYGTKCTFVVEAHECRKTIGHKNMLYPPKRHDTTIRDDGKVVVKYDDFAVLPKYIIYYYYQKHFESY